MCMLPYDRKKLTGRYRSQRIHLDSMPPPTGQVATLTGPLTASADYYNGTRDSLSHRLNGGWGHAMLTDAGRNDKKTGSTFRFLTWKN